MSGAGAVTSGERNARRGGVAPVAGHRRRTLRALSTLRTDAHCPMRRSLRAIRATRPRRDPRELSDALAKHDIRTLAATPGRQASHGDGRKAPSPRPPRGRAHATSAGLARGWRASPVAAARAPSRVGSRRPRQAVRISAYAPGVPGPRQRALAIVDLVARRAATTFNANVAPLTVAGDAPPVVPDLDDPAYARHAYYAVRLGMRRTWINRRNETFTFLDADTVRRRMSVDFTLPPSTTLRPGDMALVPLMLLTKQDLRNLDVRTSADEALPVMSTEQNGTASVLGLKGVLERLVDRLPAGHADRVVDEQALADIVYARPPHQNIAAGHVAAGGALDRQLRHAEPANRAQIERFIFELERNFMLLVPLPYWPRHRQVCKLSYDAAIRVQQAPRVARLYSAANRMLSSLGLVGRVEFFDGLAVGLADSYHAEAVPPRDTYIAEAALSVRRPGEPTDDAPITDRHAFRPHLRAKPRQRGDEGKLGLIIHAHRGELLLPLTFSSLLISVALGFLPAHAYTLDGQTLGALLLVPFALSTFYIRSQENSYVTAMLRGVRMLAVLPLLAAVWAIGLVALGTLPPDDGHRLSQTTLTEIRIPFLVAAVPTAVLIVATFSAAIGRVIRPVIRRRQERARQATRRRFFEARAAGREPPKRRLRAIGRAVAAILSSLLIAAVLVYSGWCGASRWWKAAVPTAPHPNLQAR
ncbi:MAG TPA: hypothetical protein VFR97_10540 [Capillimicrobium sp.]|nr:hypothetical protein [Capillimicrobium sp.]